MSEPATVPVTVTDEAAARIAELGIRAEVEEMIDHTLKTITCLRRIEIRLEGPYDTHDDPYLTINGYREPESTLIPDEECRQWSRWYVDRFPPRVREHVNLMLGDDYPDAG